MTVVNVPVVSVILPTYQRATSVGSAARSVLEQDVDLELIIVDDGSTDGTDRVCEQLGDPRVRYVRTPARRGAPAARNLGISMARAALVAFQDSDDRWLPGKLAGQVAAMQGRPDAVFCYTRLVRRTSAGDVEIPPNGVGPEGRLTSELLRANLISTQTVLARRAALDAVGGFDPTLPRLQDWDLWLSLADEGPVVFVDTVAVIAIETEDSITRDLPAYFVALERIVEKHRHRFARDPVAIAQHRWSLASWALRRRRPATAVRHLLIGLREAGGQALGVYGGRIVRGGVRRARGRTAGPG